VSRSSRASALKIIKREYVVYLFVVPAVLTTLVFAYLPMFGNIIAFMDYDMTRGWMGLGSRFVGLTWFRQIFTDPYFLRLIWRTLYYNMFVLVLGFPAPLVLALLINELRLRSFKRVTQTITTMPYFISWVTIAVLIYIFLSSDTYGIVNNILGKLFHTPRVIYMKNAGIFPIVLLGSSIYKTVGWGSIIYLAAISSIDAQLYEAAHIDGAGRWNQFRFITFPAILPTTVILLILTLGSFFSSNFDQIYNLQNELIREDTNVISVYMFATGVKDQKYSIATAVGLFQGVMNALMLWLSNLLSRRITDYGLF
jgi:putative aldouronate transport system permease protein